MLFDYMNDLQRFASVHGHHNAWTGYFLPSERTSATTFLEGGELVECEFRLA